MALCALVLFCKRLESGKSPCIRVKPGNSLISPCDFECCAGKAASRNWKRSIWYNGHLISRIPPLTVVSIVVVLFHPLFCNHLLLVQPHLRQPVWLLMGLMILMIYHILPPLTWFLILFLLLWIPALQPISPSIFSPSHFLVVCHSAVQSGASSSPINDSTFDASDECDASPYVSSCVLCGKVAKTVSTLWQHVNSVHISRGCFTPLNFFQRFDCFL